VPSNQFLSLDKEFCDLDVTGGVRTVPINLSAPCCCMRSSGPELGSRDSSLTCCSLLTILKIMF